MSPSEIGATAVGHAIRRARRALRIPTTTAAARADISDSLWRAIEAGGQNRDGQWTEARPRPENLEAVARVVGLDVAEVFALAGREAELEEIAEPPIHEYQLNGLPNGLRALVLGAKELPEWRLEQLRDYALFLKEQAAQENSRAEST